MPKNHGYGLSGEPWHVEYLRTESDDDRRDKRRCFFFEKGNYCSVKKERCIGSSHCDHYREKESRPKAAKYLQEDVNERRAQILKDYEKVVDQTQRVKVEGSDITLDLNTPAHSPEDISKIMANLLATSGSNN